MAANNEQARLQVGDLIRVADQQSVSANGVNTTTREEQLTRETILQLKLGALSADYFRAKFDVDIAHHFKKALNGLQEEGLLRTHGAGMQ